VEVKEVPKRVLSAKKTVDDQKAAEQLIINSVKNIRKKVEERQSNPQIIRK
jgi:hypothetical protein